MGHSLYRYDRFDPSLTRPLYGYVTDLKDGAVPKWGKRPTPSQWTVERLFDLDTDVYEGEIPRAELPAGVTKDTGGPGPTTYRVARGTYLQQHRDRLPVPDDASYHYRTVRYTVDTGRGLGGPGRRTVPSDVADRLQAIRDTSAFDRRVDGFHESFCRWELVYDLGPRGGIQDVAIVANTHH